MNAIKIGIGGPVGRKTMLVERLTRALEGQLSMAVVTNDIYTKEDAQFLVKTVFYRKIACRSRNRRMSSYGHSRRCIYELCCDR